LGHPPLRFISNKNQQFDVVVWDSTNSHLLVPSIGIFTYLTMDIKNYLYVCIERLPKALIILLISSLRLIKLFQRMSSSFDGLDKFRFLRSCVKMYLFLPIQLSGLLALRPTLVISFIDNSLTYQALDLVLSKKISFITVQNGNRYHDKDLKKLAGFEHFSTPSSFHSCFCYLSPIDLDFYRKSGWTLKEHYHVGSLAAGYTQEKLQEHFDSGSSPLEIDVLVIANSTNSRLSQRKIAELLLNFKKSNPGLRITVAAKRQPRDDDYQNHIADITALYGEGVEIVGNVEHNSFRLTLKARVVVGSYTTLLREALSVGIIVYPINFDSPALDAYFASSDLNPYPSQAEFDVILNKMLTANGDSSKFFSNYFRNYVGCVPSGPSPRERLRAIICTKIASRRAYVSSNFWGGAL